MSLALRLAPLRADTRGAAAMEFALIAPVLLIGMMGVFDLGHNMYTASVLHGAIQKAARDSTIEGAAAQGTVLDQRVTDMTHQIAPGATLNFERKSYSTFSDVSQPEAFTDVNSNGACDAGEPFEDANGSGSWDADMGQTGFGGARDAVLYVVTVTYKRPFPVSKLIGQSDMFTTVVRTVLRNQPYGPQNSSKTTGTCA